jgi:hypothetical protein
VNKRGGFCYGWHPDYELVLGVTLDDALAGTGEGFYAFHQSLRGTPFIVEAESLNVFRELTGHDRTFNPGVTAVLAALLLAACNGTPPSTGDPTTTTTSNRDDWVAAMCVDALKGPISSLGHAKKRGVYVKKRLRPDRGRTIRDHG